MRGRSRMNCEAARVADVCDVVVKLQRVDKFTSCFLAARKLESDEAAEIAAQISLRALTMNALLLRGMDNSLHLFPRPQEIDHCLRVFAVLSDAQRKRLKTLNDQKGVEG